MKLEYKIFIHYDQNPHILIIFPKIPALNCFAAQKYLFIKRLHVCCLHEESQYSFMQHLLVEQVNNNINQDKLVLIHYGGSLLPLVVF